MSTLRKAIEIKDATGGWSLPGDGITGSRACLVINICRAVRAELGGPIRVGAEGDDLIEMNKDIVRDVLIEQHPELLDPDFDPRHNGLLVKAHTYLSGAQLDRVMDKAAVIQEAQV